MKDPKQPQGPNTQAQKAQPKRAYEKPGFITSLTFERSALSCGSNLMNQGPPFGGCSLQS